ncbi:LOW QUALITY PROTEIN: membrane protein [Vibrio sp. JCM 19052]|nr:LOW QUALITY PROTEIN: membrane protein [Vibrio sp. JCM 19052]
MNYLITYFKGMAMGAADVVPGVSGGTIAFITGIYDTLLESIRRINPSLFSIWKKDGFKAAFNHINGFFLISLFAGIFTSIATLAKLISWLLETHPIPIWSFFFGLILVSVYHIIRQVEKRDAIRFVALLIGIGFATSITVLKPLHMEPTAINTILAGAIAICAMILPGISGSFILLLIGMYAPVLGAVKGFQIDILALFLVGCVAGLLSFSHLLSWLLRKFRDLTLMFLTGLMIGTLPKIWPWKETLTWRTNSKGEQVPLLEQNLSPFEFEHITSQPSQLVLAVIMMLAAIVLVLGLEKFADSNK